MLAKLAHFRALAVCLFLLSGGFVGAAPFKMENLGRGVVAMRTAGGVYVGWRLLGLDPSSIAFNLYRGGTRLNDTPIIASTNFLDAAADVSQANSYWVRPVIGGVEQPSSAVYTLPANATTGGYIRVPLQQPAGGTTPAGEAYTYSPNDCSTADLDGDGEYELVVKWDPSNSKDNSQSGYTGNVYLDAYKFDGTRLWRIDLGRNIRAGAHYTQFMVYDLDGDGKAEVACKTADATISGTGEVIGNAAADFRTTAGYILTGPEYLTIFNGRTGAILATTNYNPPRNNNPASADVSAWGDNYGNRVDRFLACVAYLDGQRPSLVMCRGYYTRACAAAWDWRDGQLTQRWVFDTGHTGGSNGGYRGQGAHSLSVADVDGDGKQEIIFGACTIDDNGVGKYTTTLGHGDALHVSDMDPNRPGLEVWMVHEDPGSYGNNGLELHDAATGAVLVSVSGQAADVGRGCAGDIDSRYPGYEVWGARGGLYSAGGTLITSSRPSPMNFMVYWDADLKREFLDGITISKWNETAFNATTLLSATGCSSNNSTKSTPNLSADLLGDWREEVVWRETSNDALRIYVSTTLATNRIYTLMHDPQYRAAITWQNTAYNQPPHPGYFLGHNMEAAPAPSITYTAGPKVAGDATEVGSNIRHPNGNVYDQSLMTGPAASFTADPGEIHRVSFVDLTNDIVQVEFSGPGTVTIILDNATGPAAPLNYNQPSVQYMKGHPSISVAGADQNTHLSVFSVGRATAVNQSLFKDNVVYDGFADLAQVSIASPVGRFGGLRTANASYFAAQSFTGIQAPGIAFDGPVFLGDLSASASASPGILLGSAADVRITGGDLLQANAKPVDVSGIARLTFTAGTNSHGLALPAQTNRAVLLQNGVDVTAQLTAP